MKIKKLPDTFYPVNIYVVITDNWEEVNKKFNQELNDEYGAAVLPISDSKIHMVFRSDFFKLHFIVHELVHVVNRIYRYCDIDLDTLNDENQAYFMDWLFVEVCKVLQKEGLIT